jgi:cardiolipin synthase
MKYQIYNTSEKAWKAMLSATAGAKKSVYLEMYILHDDSKGSQFFEALADASRRGVKVIAVLDVIGSLNILSNAVNHLRESGAEVVFCSFFFKRLHKKVLIVDESVAFVGGVNMGKEFARWKDLQVEVRGHVVKTIMRGFIRIYKRCGGKTNFSEAEPRRNPWKRAKLWFVDHGIGKRSHLFREFYKERINGATKSIVLVTPYLLPPRWLIALLHQALIRGVRVEILLPQSADHRLANSVNRSYASFLTGLGAVCYFMRGMNHAKAMIIDNREATVGSHMNLEAGVFFSEPDMVFDLVAIVNTWKGGAEIFKPDSNGRNSFHWYDIPIAFFLRLLGFVPLE